MCIDILPERSKCGLRDWGQCIIISMLSYKAACIYSTGLSRCDGTMWLMWMTVRSSCRKLTLPRQAPDQLCYCQTLTPSHPPPASHTPNMGTLPVVNTHAYTHVQCQAGDHSDIPNIPWCSSSPQLFWPVFVQLSVRTLLKQALHSLLPCRIAGQIIYGSLMAHYLAVCKSTFKSGKHGMTGYICSAENGFCSVQLFATDNRRQSRNSLFIRVAC